MSGFEYAPDKPKDCRDCFFYDGCRSKCRLGRGNCYYVIAVDAEEQFPCDNCPYHRAETPCVGYCLAEIVYEVLGRRKEENEVTVEEESEQVDGYRLLRCAAS